MKTLTSLLLLAAGSAIGAPKFEAQTIDPAISIGYGLAIGDVDGDKKPDILLADQSQIVWYQNPGAKDDREDGKEGAVSVPPAWPKHVIAENLNPRVGVRFLDNVCIAARDLDGDGKVEIAVGGNWAPMETTDKEKSGSVHILERPEDPTKRWGAKKLEHLPTVHRMHFVKVGEGYELVVLPLQGVGNVKSDGDPVKLLRYAAPDWKMTMHDTGLHATHNFEIIQAKGEPEALLIAAREGIARIALDKAAKVDFSFLIPGTRATGEVRGSAEGVEMVLAAIEPIHGSDVVIYRSGETGLKRGILDQSLNQGHALAVADVLGNGRLQVIAGWRRLDRNRKVGIKIYENAGELWNTHLLEGDSMACEDLKVADLNGDGKLDIIASGRDTRNVIIYWNKR